ncbi:hypothetical protein AVEN_97326-1 [Araneus ventricosus]|uniref:Uncharacterized protein n=1 Tax=Araneus ventricosus TaxID=182803 RepID=A0A4Y2VKD2_ARAVE|nr:hypothetical protein AVEN_97326-1 [Araneus ventricosus]
MLAHLLGDRMGSDGEGRVRRDGARDLGYQPAGERWNIHSASLIHWSRCCLQNSREINPPPFRFSTEQNRWKSEGAESRLYGRRTHEDIAAKIQQLSLGDQRHICYRFILVKDYPFMISQF